MAKTIIGTVSSTASDKTIVVKVERSKTHPLYRKRYLVTKKFMAHDAKNKAKVGDIVAVVECRPISAKKHFRLSKIIETPALSKDALDVIDADKSLPDIEEKQT